MESGVAPDFAGSLSLMGGFDMGINFDEFGENMKKFMELPIKYLDSAHEKAVGLVEDIHALIYASIPVDELPKKCQGTLNNPSSSNVITGSSPTSVQIERVDPIEESSSTAEDSSVGSVDTGAHETVSLSSNSTDSCTSENHISFGRTVGVKEQVLLCNPQNLSNICTSEDTIAVRRAAGVREKVILCNSENLLDSCTPEDPVSLRRIVSVGEEIILWNPEHFVKLPQPTEPTTVLQDYVCHELNTDKVMEQSGLHNSGHSESSAWNEAILLGKVSADEEERSGLYSANDPEKSTNHGFSDGTTLQELSADVCNDADDIINFVDIDTRYDQERHDKPEGSSVPQTKKISLKKVLMRNLSNKLRWSKKDTHMQQTLPVRSPEAVNVCYQAISSLDDLEDDWELL